MSGSLDFLSEGGEMGALIRDHDWSGTPLGAVAQWPPSLRLIVRLMLTMRQPACIFWGADSLCLYNDAYRAALGDDRHPGSLGRPASEVWADIWPLVSAQIDQVMRGDGGIYHENQPVPLLRAGVRRECYWTYSYSPIGDEAAGGIGGVFIVCTETTEQVLTARRLAEENRTRYTLFQRLPGFIGVLRGPQHVYEYVNDAYMTFAGPRELIGRPVRDPFPDLHGQGFFEMLDGVYATGEPVMLHATPIRLFGEDHDRYIDLRYDPTYNELGAIDGIFVSGYDLTERVLAEQRRATLAELSDRLRDQASASDIAFVASELLGESMRVSRAGYGTIDPVAEMLQVERDWNAPGIAPLPALVPLRDYGSFIDDLKRGEVVTIEDVEDDPRTAAVAGALEARSARAFANVPVIEQGRLVAVLYLNHDEVRRWSVDDVAFIREFADRTRTAVERSRSEAALRALAASLEEQVDHRTRERDRLWATSEDLLAIAGYAGELFRISPSWTRLLGYDEATLLSRPIMDFIHPDDADTVVSQMADVQASGRPTRFQNRFRAANGDWRWLAWSLVPEPDAPRVVAVGRDVTAEHEAADARAILEEQLRQAQKMEAVGQLTGGIAHDFNNIIQGITGSLQIAMRRLSQGRTEDIERFMARAILSANKAAALTHRLLAFSRRQPLDPRAVDANALLASLEDLFQRTIGEHISLTLVLADGLWTTLCDPNQLESSLLNLVLNARDAMPGTGALTIETGNAILGDAAVADLADVRPGAYVLLRVRDSGIGMSEDTIAQAFDPFFTTKPIGQGTGLGLSMAYGFARQSEGFVRIDSVLGEGTSITLYLPRSAASRPAAPVQGLPSGSQAPAQGSGEVVLIVEDDAVVRGLVVETLAEQGYRTLEAGDGDGGLAILRSDVRIDLLVTDMGLPGIGGRQVAQHARDIRPTLKVLFMTGYAEHAASASGFLGSGMGLITKPFEIGEFVGKIQGMIAP